MKMEFEENGFNSTRNLKASLHLIMSQIVPSKTMKRMKMKSRKTLHMKKEVTKANNAVVNFSRFLRVLSILIFLDRHDLTLFYHKTIFNVFLKGPPRIKKVLGPVSCGSGSCR